MADPRSILLSLFLTGLTCGHAGTTAGYPDDKAAGHMISVMTKTGCHPVWVSAEEERNTADRAREEVHRNTAACEAGDPFSCGLAADAYRGGRGVTLDARQAAALQKRALVGYRTQCDRADTTACVLLAGAYESGEGVPRDTDRSTSLYRRARDLDETRCQADEAQACRRLGDLVGMWTPVREYDRRAPLYAKALTLMDRECAHGSAASCAAAAAMRQQEEGVSTE